MNIYVGNLPYNATEEDLRQAFGQFGSVTSASVVIDRETGRSRGFGFVEMATDAEGAQAIQGINGKEWLGRTLTANEARPREERPRSSFSGGGGGGGSRGGFSGGGGRPSSGDSGGRERSNNWGGDRGGRGDSSRGDQGRRDSGKRRTPDSGNRKRSTNKDSGGSWSTDEDDF